MKYLKTISEFDTTFTRNETTGYIHPFVGCIQQVESNDDFEKEI